MGSPNSVPFLGSSALPASADALSPSGSAAEADRLAALHRYAILDTPPDPNFDRLTALAARLLRVPIVLITLLDEKRLWPKSCYGVPLREVARETSFCTHAIHSEGVFVVEDARIDPRFATHPMVVGEAGVRFYAGAPLRAPGGETLGMLCLIDCERPRTLTPEEQRTLMDLADMVMHEMNLRLVAASANDAAEALRAREQWFRSLVQNASDMITVLDAQGRVLYKSPSAQRIMASALQESLDHDFLEEIFPQDRERVDAFLHTVLSAPERSAPIEFRVLHPEGTLRVLEANGTNLLNDLDVRGIVINARDVTERKYAEAALQEADAQIEALVQASPLAIITTDLQGIVQSWNVASEQIFGWRRDEVIGTFVPLVAPLEREHFDALRDRLVKGESLSRIEVRRTARDGTPRDVSFSVGPLRNAQGQVCGIMAVVADITRRRQAEEALEHAEEKYRSIFENAVEGIFQTTLDGRCVSANPSLARILGYDSPEELLESVTDIATNLYAEESRRAEFVRLMEEQNAVTDFVSQVYRKNGTRVWISENARAVRAEDGHILYFEGTVEDITERMTLEAEREVQLAEALERADHDPLTGLLNHRAFHRMLEQEADRAQREGTTLAMAVLDLDNFKFFNDAYGHAVGDDVLRQIASALSGICRSYDTLARFGGDEFALLLPGMSVAEVEEFAARLTARTQAIGFYPPGSDTSIPLGLSIGVAVFPDDGPGRLEALAVADTRLLRAKSGGQDEGTERLRATLTRSLEGFSMLDALVTAVDNKDRYTRRHSEDVMRYSIAIAQELGMDETTQDIVRVAALLHDVGKIGVPDALLRKPGKLADEEYEAIKHHPMMGSIIVGSVPGFEAMLDAVRHHHERWDGEGYPFGLKEDSVPLMARLMAVADAYSAMTTDRPYRKGMAAEKALSLLEQGAGTQWDPVCVDAFARSQRAFLRVQATLRDTERILRYAYEELPPESENSEEPSSAEARSLDIDIRQKALAAQNSAYPSRSTAIQECVIDSATRIEDAKSEQALVEAQLEAVQAHLSLQRFPQKKIDP